MTARRRELLGLGLLLGVALAARLPGIGQSLWFDEVTYATDHKIHDLERLVYFLRHSLSAPLYTVLMFGYRRVFGEAEWVLRLPSLVAGVLSVFLTYRLARSFSSAACAGSAAALLALSPPAIWYSREAVPHSLAVCLLLAALVLWTRRSEERSRWWWAGYGLVLALAAQTHSFYVLAVFPLSFIAFFERGAVRRRALVSHAAVFALFALAIGLKTAFGNVRTEAFYLRPFTLYEWWMALFSWFPYGNTLWTENPYAMSLETLLATPGRLTLHIALFGLWLGGLVVFARRHRMGRGWEVPACMLVFPLALLALTLLGKDKLYVERYLLQSVPLVCIVLAVAVHALPGRWLRGLCLVGLLGLGLTGAVRVWMPDEEWTVTKQNPDWRAVAAYIDDELRSGLEHGISFGASLRALEYYIAKRRARDGWEAPDGPPADGPLKVFHIVNLGWMNTKEQERRALEALHANDKLRFVETRAWFNVRISVFVLES